MLPPFTFAALGFCGGASASRGRVRSACAQLTKGGASQGRILSVMFEIVVRVLSIPETAAADEFAQEGILRHEIRRDVRQLPHDLDHI